MKIRMYVTQNEGSLTTEKFQQHIADLQRQGVTVQTCKDKHEETFFLQQKKREGLLVNVLVKSRISEAFFGMKYSDYVFNQINLHLGL